MEEYVLSKFHLPRLTLNSLPKQSCALASIAVMGLPFSALAAGTQYSALANSLRHPEAAASQTVQVSGNEPVHFAISLQLRDAAGLQAFADQVSNPASPLYKHFITPEEVGNRFGPTQADVDEVVSFLKSNGLQVGDISKNRMLIVADGSADAVSAAFRTKLAYAPRVDESGNPDSYRTNITALQVPSAIASKVLSVDGIDTSIRRRARNTSTLNPALFRGVYGGAAAYSAGYYGQGVHIAIANWDGYRLNNVPYWTSANALPVPSGGSGSNITVVKVGTGTTYGAGSPQGEGDLDIQAVMEAAPLANIYIYDDTTTDTAAPLTTYSKISSDNLADVVSESYGWETSNSSTYYASTYVSAHNIHLSLTSQGITYLAATGDNGTSAFPSRGVRYAYPDIDPEVLQVGGTVATVNSTTGARVSETPWGLSGGVGGTGGFDPYDTSAHGFTFNVAPAYQKTYIASKTGTYNYRLLPDISSSAGGQNGLGGSGTTGWALVIYYNTGTGTSYPPGTSIAIDGTSIASPATAGGLGALLGEVFTGVTPNASRSNVRFGRVQDYLYSIGSNSSVFYDITTGSSIGTLPGTKIAATPAAGWDFATGWGSLTFSGLYNYIKSSGILP